MSEQQDIVTPEATPAVVRVGAPAPGEQPTPTKQPRREKHVTLLGAILMQAITVALCVGAFYVLDARRDTGAVVVTADTQAIVNAKLLEMQGQGLADEEFSKQSSLFVKKLSARLEEYKASGFMVVNDNAVVVSPSAVNITGELATHVGLNPSAVMRGKNGQSAR